MIGFVAVGKSESGFTLTELMVVIGIFGIMVAIAVPNFLALTPRMSLKSAARDIVSNMQMARINALRYHSTWAIQFDTATDRYTVLSDDGADDTWNTGDDTVYKTMNLSDYRGLSYGSGHGKRTGATSDPTDGVSFSGNRVTFQSNGTSKSGTVYIMTADGETFAVGSLSATGRIKTWRNYGSGWED